MLVPTLDKHKGDGTQEFMLIKTPVDLYPLRVQALSNCGTHFGAYFWQVHYCDPGGVPKAQGTKAKAKVHHS